MSQGEEEDFFGGEVDEGEEFIVDDDQCDFSFTPDTSAYESQLRSAQEMVHNCSAFLPDCEISLSATDAFSVSLRRDFLPLSQQAVLGLRVDPFLLHLSFSLDEFRWYLPPSSLEFHHPVFGTQFVGRPLLRALMNHYFSQFYEPKTTFRSSPYLLSPQSTPKRSNVVALVKRKFDEHRVIRALGLCGDNVEAAATFLMTGALPPGTTVALPFRHSQNPLLHLILELGDLFLDLSDHCCMCRAVLPAGVKPSSCSAELCRRQMADIGIGNSVIQEIKRDPVAADLVLSIFAGSVGTAYMRPAPPGFEVPQIIDILGKIPSMKNMLSAANNEKQLLDLIGGQAMTLLRWVLLSNRSHLIHLNGSLELREFGGCQQFMALLSSPEAEEVFNALKAKYGSFHLWHGSRGERWHPIIRQGLRNLTGTPDQANGAALGAGIYFARDSSTSAGYSQSSATNLYVHSNLGKALNVISLCEVAKVPADDVTVSLPARPGETEKRTVKGFLKDHGWAHTLTMEEACIVRFLFVGASFRRDVISDPLKKVPTLRDVLEFHAQSGQ